MAARLSRWLLAVVLLTSLLGTLPSRPALAQETPTETAGPDAAEASPTSGEPTETATPTEIAPETATTEPTSTATTVAPDASPVLETSTPTTPAEATPPTGTPTTSPTGTPTGTASPTGTPGDAVSGAGGATATPGQPIALSDIVVTISCRRQTETITIQNTGGRSVFLNTIETMYAPVRGEPFVLEERLRPGRTVVFSMGSKATGRVLTRDAIFTNSVGDQDGLILGLSIGTITRRCPPVDQDATPRPDPTVAPVTSSYAVVTNATRLRGAPRSSSPTIRTLPKGTIIATTGMAYSRYVSVAHNATRGWVLASDVSFDLPSTPAGRPATTTDTVNLRSSPSTSASVLTVLSAGTRVTYTGRTQNGFRSVAYLSMTGWVHRDYLAISSAGAEEWIDVDRSEGVVTLYRGTTVVARYDAHTSADASSHGFYATAVGTYYVYNLYEPLGYTPYGNSYIRYWVGFDANRENGFHSWEMDSAGNILPESSRATSGCVSTPPTIARAIFNFAELGMRVVVHW